MTLRELLARGVLVVRHRAWPYPNDHLVADSEHAWGTLSLHNELQALTALQNAWGHPLPPSEGSIYLPPLLDLDGWDPYVPKE